MHTKTYLLLLSLAGCGGVNVETQPQRFDYLKEKTAEDIKKLTQCEDAKLTFRESNRVGTTWYDTYTLEGCGQKTDYITGLTRTGDWITWQYGVAPQPEQLREAAKDQLTKTAEFDLNCKSALDFTILNEVFDPMHVSLVASVGVRGCDKQSTYRTSCGNTNYQNGKHVITCTSVVTSATSQ
jgi:hypothetical protein